MRIGAFGCRHSLTRHYTGGGCKVVLCKTIVDKDYPAFMIPNTFISWITLDQQAVTQITQALHICRSVLTALRVLMALMASGPCALLCPSHRAF